MFPRAFLNKPYKLIRTFVFVPQHTFHQSPRTNFHCAFLFRLAREHQIRNQCDSNNQRKSLLNHSRRLLLLLLQKQWTGSPLSSSKTNYPIFNLMQLLCSLRGADQDSAKNLSLFCLYFPRKGLNLMKSNRKKKRVFWMYLPFRSISLTART